jgi:hypothetical protein
MNSRYVKVCLTAIVLLLTAIVLKPILSPTTAEAQSSLNAIQISAWSDGGFLLYDNSAGRLWSYGFNLKDPVYWGQLQAPGMPLVRRR